MSCPRTMMPPPGVMQMNEQVIADLAAAKAYMQKHGRCTTGAADREGRVCIAVAVNSVVRSNQPPETIIDQGRCDRVSAANALIEKVTPTVAQRYPRERPRRNFVEYNEHPDTTDEDIWNLWDKALAEAGGL